MALGAEQLLSVTKRLVVLGPAAVAVIPNVPLVAGTLTVTLAGSVTLAFPIPKAARTGITVRTNKSIRTANLNLIDTEPLLQVRLLKLMLFPPFLDQWLMLLRQLMALVFSAADIPTQALLDFDQSKLTRFVAAKAFLFPRGVTALVFGPFCALQAVPEGVY